MKTRLMISALLAAATFSTAALAHGGDRDWDGRRDWRAERHDDWREEQWRHEHWRHDHRPPPVFAYGYGYPPPPPPRVYYESPVVQLPLPPLLPPLPHVVLRDILRGH